MPLEVTEITTRPEDTERFKAAFLEAAGLLLQVPGCEEAKLLQCLEKPTLFNIQVRWRTMADHTQHYPATAQSQSVRALLTPMIQSRRMFHFDLVGAA